MINLKEILVKKDREIIIDEKDVMSTLKSWNTVKCRSRFYNRVDIEIGCCTESEEETRWLAQFSCTDKQWKEFIQELNAKNHKLMLEDDNKIYVV